MKSPTRRRLAGAKLASGSFAAETLSGCQWATGPPKVAYLARFQEM
jgi:hypothetical protein